MKGTIKSRSPL